MNSLNEGMVPITLSNLPRFKFDRRTAKCVDRLVTAAGLPGPIVVKRTHCVSASAFRACPAKGMCRSSGSYLRFGRITQVIGSLISSLPLTRCCFWCHPSASMEIPELVMSYYDPYRHSLDTFPSVRACAFSLTTAVPSLSPRRCSRAHRLLREGLHRVRNHGSMPVAVWISATRRRAPRLEP